MTALDVFEVVLVGLVISGSVTLLVLAAVVLVRSRRDGTAGLFGRAVHRPRLWVAGASCGGIAGLLFEARELMPTSWQEPSRNLLAVLQLAFFVLLLTHGFSQMAAKRRQHG